MEQELVVFGHALGFETLTVDNTVGGVGFTPAEYKNVSLGGSAIAGVGATARAALVTADGTAGTNDVRWTCDGTAPTTSIGHLLKGGQTLSLQGAGNITKFRAIRTGGTNGTLQVTFFI